MNNLLTITLVLTLFLFSFNSNQQVEKFPPIKMLPEYKAKIVLAQEKYIEVGYNYKLNAQDYESTGDYFNFRNKRFVNNNTMMLDESGFPKVKYGDKFYYNPVTQAQFALSAWSKYINGEEGQKDVFLKATDFLLTLGDKDGAYRYEFPYKYRSTVLEPGWVSGMAQGQVLSVYARAYSLTKSRKYLDAGKKAFHFMIKPVEDGGTLTTLEDLDPSLDNYIFFEEVVTFPSCYILNGYLFTMFGIYDWAEATNNINAKIYWKKSLETLKVILPYYDAGGFSTYDLSFMTYTYEPQFTPVYHSIHLYLINGIYSITGDIYFDYIKKVWGAYVEQ